MVLKNYTLSKFFIPLIKGKVSTKFEAIFDGNLKGADLTKIVKILYYLKLCQETIFG